MSTQSTIGVGVIGLGFMGSTHVGGYQAAERAGYPCHLVAVCDSDPARRTGKVAPVVNLVTTDPNKLLFNPAQVGVYADANELLADSAVHLVSICTHTQTHVDLAVQALRAGKHVLVEKPVALKSSDVRCLAEAAEAAGAHCMAGMCVRFWPGWSWLKEQIDSGTLGAVKSASFQRLGNGPDWSLDFYRRTEWSGGALVDLHIHDADFIRWCFGEPDSVVSTGSSQHVTTIYRYAHGPPHVLAEGGWLGQSGFSFRMRYLVVFEQAIAEFDLAGDPPLLLTRDGKAQAVPLERLTGYDLEIRHLIDAISKSEKGLIASIADAEATARLLEAEQRSLETGAIVAVRETNQ
jgi:predicted dehydrogenase